MLKTILQNPARVNRSSPYSILGLKEGASNRKIDKALRQAGRDAVTMTENEALNDPDKRLFIQAFLTLYYPALLEAYHQRGTFDETSLRVWLATKAIRDGARLESATPAPVHAVVTIRHASSPDGPFGEDQTLLDEPCLLQVTEQRVFLAPLTSNWEIISWDIWKQAHAHSTAARRTADFGLEISAEGKSLRSPGYVITSLAVNNLREGELHFRVPGLTSSPAGMIDDLEDLTREVLIDRALAENREASSLDIARATIESLGYGRDEPPVHTTTLVHTYQGVISNPSLGTSRAHWCVWTTHGSTCAERTSLFR